MIVSAVLLLADVEWDGHMDADGAWWVAMAIGMVLFWALIILGIVWLVREMVNARQARQSAGEDDPMAILERRLALGEISPDEYHERRAILRGESRRSAD